MLAHVVVNLTQALVLAGVGGTLGGVLGLCWARGVGYKWGKLKA